MLRKSFLTAVLLTFQSMLTPYRVTVPTFLTSTPHGASWSGPTMDSPSHEQSSWYFARNLYIVTITWVCQLLCKWSNATCTCPASPDPTFTVHQHKCQHIAHRCRGGPDRSSQHTLQPSWHRTVHVLVAVAPACLQPSSTDNAHRRQLCADCQQSCGPAAGNDVVRCPCVIEDCDVVVKVTVDQANRSLARQVGTNR